MIFGCNSYAGRLTDYSDETVCLPLPSGKQPLNSQVTAMRNRARVTLCRLSNDISIRHIKRYLILHSNRPSNRIDIIYFFIRGHCRKRDHVWFAERTRVSLVLFSVLLFSPPAFPPPVFIEMKHGQPYVALYCSVLP